MDTFLAKTFQAALCSGLCPAAAAAEAARLIKHSLVRAGPEELKTSSGLRVPVKIPPKNAAPENAPLKWGFSIIF